jgi:HSP20 family protein
MAGTPAAWMWAEACELIERAERLQRQFFQPAMVNVPGWMPPVDIFEEGRQLWIVAAVPGVAAQDIQVAVEPTAVVITGQRRLPTMTRGASISRLELPHGSFSRRIEAPPGRLRLERTELTNGCLVVQLRKIP